MDHVHPQRRAVCRIEPGGAGHHTTNSGDDIPEHACQAESLTRRQLPPRRTSASGPQQSAMKSSRLQATARLNGNFAHQPSLQENPRPLRPCSSGGRPATLVGQRGYHVFKHASIETVLAVCRVISVGCLCAVGHPAFQIFLVAFRYPWIVPQIEHQAILLVACWVA